MATDPWGIDDGYDDVHGQWHPTPPETAEALRRAMGADPGPEAPPTGRPLWIVAAGTAPALLGPCGLTLEDGTELAPVTTLPPDLPLGYHDLHPTDGGPTTRLIVSPGACHLPPHLRAWMLTVQLPACRSAGSWGVGDAADLARIGAWAGSRGAGMVAVNPLHAPLPLDPVEPSPYYPSSRRWRNPLYIRIDQVPGASDDPIVAELAEQAHRLNDDRVIDRDRAWALKRRALERLWERRGRDPGFARWRVEGGRDIDDYATFCALAEHHGGGWSGWPEEHRHPGSREVATFAARRAERVSFWAWLQYLLDQQLRRAGEALPLLTDLAIGVDPDGADAWMLQDLLALGTRVGAPPDVFNRAGQDWGLPPFVPWKLREAAYEPLARLWRAALGGGGGGVRIDHVMGLFRLYWLPPGIGATDGAYVRYRGDELLAVLAVESVRAGAVVVGEDLGTVEPTVRTVLADANVLAYKLVWFEDEPPEQYPAQALAGVTTHDLPTIAGAWTGADDEDQRAAGVEPDPSAMDDLRRRLRDVSGRPADAPLEDVIVDVHARLAAGPCSLVAATIEDGLAVPERPNLPGTTSERPNWSFGLPVSLEKALDHPLLGRVADALQR
ncbi:MAG TPA: 4-alpha-glucanotransferase [Acidimicrobiales bacterium]|nr:4-alpha-glucanotransferase [Acidimicrobiales bacterium]